jgi:predicted RNA-binding protein YlqC (UPF0109 family)
MSNIDQQFIEYVVKSLVGNPDAVHIDRRIDEKGVLLELTVDPEDLGRVIGKRGATAQSIRTLLRALGTKNDARYNLKIIDNGTGGHGAPSSDAPAPARSSSDDDQADTTATVDDEPVAPPVAEAVPEPVATEAPAPDEEKATSDRLRQAREELADLDDLDV